MTNEAILRAVGDIPDEFLEDAVLPAAPVRRLHWQRWAALAACLAVVVVGVFAAARFSGGAPDDSAADQGVLDGGVSAPDGSGGVSDPLRQEDGGVTIPQTQFALGMDDGMGADMIGFFIYGGRSYVQYENIDGQYADQLIGQRLGTSRGLIDEWTPEEGYVELAGSVRGDFYEARGFDPGFLLCMRWADGNIALYVNNNDMTLRTGADLYEDRLHLTENYAGLSYETHDSWYSGPRALLTLSPEQDQAALDFIAALDAGEFLPRDAIPAPENPHLSIYDTLETYHVYFQTLSGVPVHIRLLDGGYVIFTGLYPVCVQVDQAAYDAFISLLDIAGVPAVETGLTDFEKCQADPVFGAYMPQTEPDQYASIYYDIDPETAAILGTREIELGYSNGGNGGSWYLNYLHPGAEEEGEPILTPEDLTEEALDALRITNKGGRVLSFGVRVDDIVITFHGYGEPIGGALALGVMEELLP